MVLAPDSRRALVAVSPAAAISARLALRHYTDALVSIIVSVEGCLAVEAKEGSVNALTGGTVMADGFAVEVEEIRAHAAKLEALRHRFGAIKSAGASIRGLAADALIRTSREYADVDDSVADTIRHAGRL
jgi:hypothetical protein